MFAVPGRRDAYEGYQLISSSYCDPPPAEIRSVINIVMNAQYSTS